MKRAGKRGKDPIKFSFGLPSGEVLWNVVSMLSDFELLRRYAEEKSEAAFSELVRRQHRT